MESVIDLVSTLEEPERIVVRMHYLEEIPIEQIAPVLSLRPAAVHRIKRDALRKLRSRHLYLFGDLYGE